MLIVLSCEHCGRTSLPVAHRADAVIELNVIYSYCPECQETKKQKDSLWFCCPECMVEFVKEGRFEKVWQRKQQTTYEKLWEGMPEPNFGESYKERPWSVELVGGGYGTERIGMVMATDHDDACKRAIKKFDISEERDPYYEMSLADDLCVQPIKEEEVEEWKKEER